MSHRAPHLQQFVGTLDSALRQRVPPGAAPAPVAERILTALASPAEAGLDGTGRHSTDERLAVQEHLPRALDTAAGPESPVAAVGRALQDIAPELDWRRRPGSDSDADFFGGHANATVLGYGGLEQRRDVTVGLSLVAPGIRYPDHNHPPEEVYLVLSPGEWWQAGGAWHEPGIGGIVHNPPGIMHAMRAGDAPLLAVWLLWMEG